MFITFRQKKHKIVSNPSEINVLNGTDFKKEESFSLDQSTSSRYTHTLNVYPYSNIENIISNNPNGVITAQLSISSLPKLIWFTYRNIWKYNVDILLMSEVETDSSFPTRQFKIKYYTMDMLDWNSNRGGTLLYFREDITIDTDEYWIIYKIFQKIHELQVKTNKLKNNKLDRNFK